MTPVRVRAERAAHTVGYGLVTGLAGAAVGAVTGGLGWALVVGGASAVAGGQVGRTRPDSAARRNARLTAATADQLGPLRRDGWHLLHARPIGQDTDRMYHLCVPPSAHLVVVVMDWAGWPADAHISRDEDGNLYAGEADGEVAVDWVLHAADTVGQALWAKRKTLGNIGLAQVLPVHGASVGTDGHVQVHRDHDNERREINVVQAQALVDKMRTVPTAVTRRTKRAAWACTQFLDVTFP
ncbi:hypothetical protein ABR738_00640 [Streptomyces sp. Edi4]|uniref:hypothetical protein n=1 Tax=Streptomyces sp. Edi4 TaxID=3162527 RepID=UPI0033059F79